MKKPMILVGGVLTLALCGIGASSAIAATMPAAPAQSSSAVSTPPTNGNSTTPDPGSTSTQEPNGTETPDAQEAPGTEKPGTEKPGASDGNDGGHADPEGVDINHVGDANEK